MRFFKIRLFLGITFLVSLVAFGQKQNSSSLTFPVTKFSNFVNPNRILLPKNYPVWVLGRTVLNRPAPGPFPGFKQKILPTYNFYKGHPGCYIACYSNQGGVFPVSNTVFVKGQVRVSGHYQGRICQPAERVSQDISKDPQLKNLCRTFIKSCKTGKCWVNGNTGAWLGIQYPVH